MKNQEFQKKNSKIERKIKNLKFIKKFKKRSLQHEMTHRKTVKKYEEKCFKRRKTVDFYKFMSKKLK